MRFDQSEDIISSGHYKLIRVTNEWMVTDKAWKDIPFRLHYSASTAWEINEEGSDVRVLKDRESVLSRSAITSTDLLFLVLKADRF